MNETLNAVYDEPFVRGKNENLYRLTRKPQENGWDKHSMASNKSTEVMTSAEEMSCSSICVENCNYRRVPAKGSSDTTPAGAGSVNKSSALLEDREVSGKEEFSKVPVENNRYKNIGMATCLIFLTITLLALAVVVVAGVVVIAGIRSELSATTTQSDLNLTVWKEMVENANEMSMRALRVFDSCAAIVIPSHPFESGYYYVKGPTGSAVLVYCSLVGEYAGWRRLAYFDMNTSTEDDCPSNFNYVRDPPSCKPTKTEAGCTSVTYKVNGIKYNSVTGRIVSRQYLNPDAFTDSKGNRRSEQEQKIEGNYVDGISLTYTKSSTAKHIWTFAAGIVWDDNPIDCDRCFLHKPDFVGSNFSCEINKQCDQTNCQSLLWDGQQCVGNATFHRELSEQTVADVQMRVCMDQDQYTDEGIHLTLVELYIH